MNTAAVTNHPIGDDLHYPLRWAAAYLADRYYLGERGATYRLDGYAIEDPYRPFSVDVALGFIGLSRRGDPKYVEPACRKLLFTSLYFIDDDMVAGKTLNDVDISIPWMLYEHYVTLTRENVDHPRMGQFAAKVFQFIFQINAQALQDMSRYDLGRGIVETLELIMPVAARFEEIFDETI